MVEMLEDVPQYILEEPNRELRDVYVTNRNHIHVGQSHVDIKSVYNFPSNNLNRDIVRLEGI